MFPRKGKTPKRRPTPPPGQKERNVDPTGLGSKNCLGSSACLINLPVNSTFVVITRLRLFRSGSLVPGEKAALAGGTRGSSRADPHPYLQHS